MNLGFLNFYMSALRNMFLTSSVAIGMIGFSDRFSKTNKLLILLTAFCIIVLSIAFGLKSTENFIIMLRKETQNKGLTELDKELLKQCKQWPMFAYFYVGFLSIILLAFVIKQLRIYL